MEIKSAVNILTHAAADGQIDEVIKLAIQTVLPLLNSLMMLGNLQLNSEEWRDVRDYEGLYQVSNFGRVKSFYHNTPKIIYQSLNSAGYWRVCLVKNGKRKDVSVHRLVAQAFLPNPDNKPQVDHLNGDKRDNRVENLEWVTRKENTHANKWQRNSKSVWQRFLKLYTRGYERSYGYVERRLGRKSGGYG